jgi:hypothetical protein
VRAAGQETLRRLREALDAELAEAEGWRSERIRAGEHQLAVAEIRLDRELAEIRAGRVRARKAREKEVRQILSALPAGEPVEVGVWSGEEDPFLRRSDIPLRFGGSNTPPDVTESYIAPLPGCTRCGVDPWEVQREITEAEVVGGLFVLRDAAHSARRHLRFYFRGSQGLAIRAGSIFHQSSGVEVDVIQNGVPWELARPRTRVIPHVGVEHLGEYTDPSSSEVHMLLSFTASVERSYRYWLRNSETRPRWPVSTLHIVPEGGPRAWDLFRHPVQEGSVVAFADRVAAEMARERGRQGCEDLVFRVFIAAPEVLSFAFGRSLSDLGEIAVMDRDDEGMYQETMRFRT